MSVFDSGISLADLNHEEADKTTLKPDNGILDAARDVVIPSYHCHDAAIFQQEQDSAPAHCACHTVQLLQRETRKSIRLLQQVTKTTS